MLITEDMVKEWLESNDPFMVQLGKDSVGEEVPDMQQATLMLQFFTVFAIGCQYLKLTSLNDIHRKRADMYAHALGKMGYTKGWRVGHNMWGRRLGTLDRILTSASYTRIQY